VQEVFNLEKPYIFKRAIGEMKKVEFVVSGLSTAYDNLI